MMCSKVVAKQTLSSIGVVFHHNASTFWHSLYKCLCLFVAYVRNLEKKGLFYCIIFIVFLYFLHLYLLI